MGGDSSEEAEYDVLCEGWVGWGGVWDEGVGKEDVRGDWGGVVKQIFSRTLVDESWRFAWKEDDFEV